MAVYSIKMLRDEEGQSFVPFTSASAVLDTNEVSLQELMTNGKYKIINNVTTASAGTGVLDAYQGKVLNDKFGDYVPSSQKGVANGVATLGNDGKVPTAQLPSYVDDVIEAYTRSGTTPLSSTWLSLTDGGTALTPDNGKIYVVLSSGDYQNKQYRWGGSTYVLCNPSDVNSVNGFTGVVTLKTLTIQKNGTQVGDTFNGSADKVVNIAVPTKTSDITNDSGFITASDSITGNAATATSATNATNDANGNNIVNTYVTKGTTQTITGAKTFSTASGFIYSGMENGTTNSARNVWFSHASTLGTPVYNNNFKYNPATDVLTVGSITGNAATATKFAAAKQINGTNFDGSADITTAQWGTSRNIGIVNSDGTGTAVTVAVNGSGNVNLKLPATIKADITGTVTGNASSATIATGDKNGLDITNYIKGLSVSGTTITYTKGDNTTGTITTQDTTYILPVAGTGINGSLGGIKVGSGLTIDSTTGVLSATGGGTADNVEWSGILNKPTDVSYWTNDSGYITLSNVMSGATANTAGTAGVVPAPASGEQAKFLRGDGQWASPSTTAYTAGSGLTLDGTQFKHSNSVVAGTAGTSSATSGSTINVPYVSYDAQGHITVTGTHVHTVTGFAVAYSGSSAPSSGTGNNGDIYIQTA